MARRIILRTWAATIFLAVAVLFSATGCLSVEAPKEINVDVPDYYQRHDSRDDHRRDKDEDCRRDRGKGKRRKGKLDKDEAYDIAKDLARTEGVDTGRFKIHDKKIDGVYWVLFERKGRRGGPGWRRHFAVRVARSRGQTRATLYKGEGRQDYSSDMDEDKVEKDEAYKYAKKMARKQGAKPRRYEIHDKKIDNNYWVLFEHKNPKRSRGWENHFAVRVSRRGTATFYR